MVQFYSRLKKLLILRVFFILFALSAPIWVQVTTLATIAQPDSTPTFSKIHVNRDLILSGDICVYGEYTLPYTSIPTTPADQTFIFRLMGTDNVTELGAVSPFVYFNNGYGLGVFSFYFASATTDNFTWDSPYIIRVSEVPAQFTSPTYFDYVMPLVDTYSSSLTQAGNQNDMAVRILSMAQDMEAEYTAYTFLEQAASGTVLSAPTGATYFRGAIPGLQPMAPSLFLIQAIELDVTSANWTTAQADTYEGRFDGTWVGTSENATAIRLGVTRPTLMAMFIGLPACLGFLFVAQRKWQRTEPGLITCSILLVMLLIMGWMPYAIFASVFQIMGIYVAYLLFFAKS